jgi:hypothetical protein
MSKVSEQYRSCSLLKFLRKLEKQNLRLHPLFWDVTRRKLLVFLPTFRDTIRDPSSGVIDKRKKSSRSLLPGLLKAPINCAETSVSNCRSRRRNVAEQRRPQEAPTGPIKNSEAWTGEEITKCGVRQMYVLVSQLRIMQAASNAHCEACWRKNSVNVKS